MAVRRLDLQNFQNYNNHRLGLKNLNTLSFQARSSKIADTVVLNSGYSKDLNKLIRTLKSDYKHLKDQNILILFSGGFDTSFMAKFFQEEIGAKVHTLSFNLGDKRLPIDRIKQQAEKIGVHKHIEVDATEEFVNKFVLPSLFANSRYNGQHPLSSSLSRPLMMEKAVELAKEHDCKVLMQGTSPWQNNAPRFQKAFSYLNRKSKLKMELPVLKFDIPRKLEKEYLDAKGIKISDREGNIFSADGNIWNWEAEDGRIATESGYRPNLQSNGTFNTPQNAPDMSESVAITFKKGVPIKLNGEKLSFRKIIENLNIIGGKHGIGIHDAHEHRPLGFREREIHVSPAADILITAHEHLEQLVSAQDTIMFKRFLDNNWTNSVCNGDWYRQPVKMMNAAIKIAQERVTGMIKLNLYRGHIDIIDRKSPHSLDAHTIGVEKELIPSTQGFEEGAYLSGKGL